jgi:hypothetical protein
MRYLLMIIGELPAEQTEAEMAAEMAAHDAFTGWLVERGWLNGGEALQPASTAMTVRLRGGQRLVTDGPFAETKEEIGGFYIVDVPTLDDALEAASRLPGVETGAIEVRPIMELG